MKKFTTLFCFSLFLLTAYAQSHISKQSHQSNVSCIQSAGSVGGFDAAYFSAGEDGFLIKWTNDNQGEHYQITDVSIKMIAVSPSGNEIAVYETDGGSVNKVSIWNWKTFTRIKQFKYSDSITSLAFSAKGTYLIIGTATVDGAVFIRTSNWSVVDKIKTNTSIVNYITTSATEKTCVFYSPTGNLSYYNLGTGVLKDKISVPQGLSQCTLFNNNIFFAGIKDNMIYVVNAFKGNTVSTIQAQNPIILSNSEDSNLYYLEYDGRNTYELKMLENMDGHKVSNPRIVKTIKGPRGSAAINTGCKFNTEIILGGKSGNIFKMDTDPSITLSSMTEITENTYSKIYDICSTDSNFYFLTKDAVYRSSYDTGIVNKLASTKEQTQIIPISDTEVILCSYYTKKPVTLLNLITNEDRVLFTPKNNLQAIKISNTTDVKYLVEIESNSFINLYNLETNEFSEAYAGTGIQDAVLSDTGLYIAKSASTNPKNPLICMNINTMETVPLSIKGNVSFGLSYSGDTLYGINLTADENGEFTYVFSYNTKSKQFTNVLKFASEDSGAFTYVRGGNLYTNIGKNKIYCVSIQTKKMFSYNRSASIPTDICQTADRVAILNNDGSISWCTNKSNQILADWYMTNDGQWNEF